MQESEMTLELSPRSDGRYTLIKVHGTFETTVQPREVRSLLKVLAYWSGAPVDVVLYVDGTNSGSCWLEMWDDVLARVRGRRLYELHCAIDRKNTGTPPLP